MIPLITLSTRGGEWQASHPRCFNPQYLINAQVDGPQSQFGCSTEDRNLLLLPQHRRCSVITQQLHPLHNPTSYVLTGPCVVAVMCSSSNSFESAQTPGDPVSGFPRQFLSPGVVCHCLPLLYFNICSFPVSSLFLHQPAPFVSVFYYLF